MPTDVVFFCIAGLQQQRQ